MSTPAPTVTNPYHPYMGSTSTPQRPRITEGDSNIVTPGSTRLIDFNTPKRLPPKSPGAFTIFARERKEDQKSTEPVASDPGLPRPILPPNLMTTTAILEPAPENDQQNIEDDRQNEGDQQNIEDDQQNIEDDRKSE